MEVEATPDRKPPLSEVQQNKSTIGRTSTKTKRTKVKRTPALMIVPNANSHKRKANAASVGPPTPPIAAQSSAPSIVASLYGPSGELRTKNALRLAQQRLDRKEKEKREKAEADAEAKRTLVSKTPQQRAELEANARRKRDNLSSQQRVTRSALKILQTNARMFKTLESNDRILQTTAGTLEIYDGILETNAGTSEIHAKTMRKSNEAMRANSKAMQKNEAMIQEMLARSKRISVQLKKAEDDLQAVIDANAFVANPLNRAE